MLLHRKKCVRRLQYGEDVMHPVSMTHVLVVHTKSGRNIWKITRIPLVYILYMNDITVQCESEFGTQQIITFSTGLYTPVEIEEWSKVMWLS